MSEPYPDLIAALYELKARYDVARPTTWVELHTAPSPPVPVDFTRRIEWARAEGGPLTWTDLPWDAAGDDEDPVAHARFRNAIAEALREELQ